LLQIFKASPLFGLGPANYYYYTSLFPLLGWYVKFNSHNNYMDILIQYGALGLGIFMWLVIELGILAGKLYRRLEDPFSRAYSAAALGGLAALLVSGLLGDWFLPFLYNIGYRGFRTSVFAWIFLGGLVALARIWPGVIKERVET
jgi:hypothetical protein